MTDLDRLFTMVPHRPPMLLLSALVHVDEQSSSARIDVARDSSFCGKEGVPSWIGLEYMGQTAALIAGYQRQQGMISPHLGFLLGTRRYQAFTQYFSVGEALTVYCHEKAVVGDTLATFDCRIETSQKIVAEASLSVYRKNLAADQATVND